MFREPSISGDVQRKPIRLGFPLKLKPRAPPAAMAYQESRKDEGGDLMSPHPTPQKRVKKKKRSKSGDLRRTLWSASESDADALRHGSAYFARRKRERRLIEEAGMQPPQSPPHSGSRGYQHHPSHIPDPPRRYGQDPRHRRRLPKVAALPPTSEVERSQPGRGRGRRRTRGRGRRPVSTPVRVSRPVSTPPRTRYARKRVTASARRRTAASPRAQMGRRVAPSPSPAPRPARTAPWRARLPSPAPAPPKPGGESPLHMFHKPEFVPGTKEFKARIAREKEAARRRRNARRRTADASETESEEGAEVDNPTKEDDDDL